MDFEAEYMCMHLLLTVGCVLLVATLVEENFYDMTTQHGLFGCCCFFSEYDAEKINHSSDSNKEE